MVGIFLCVKNVWFLLFELLLPNVDHFFGSGQIICGSYIKESQEGKKNVPKISLIVSQLFSMVCCVFNLWHVFFVFIFTFVLYLEQLLLGFVFFSQLLLLHLLIGVSIKSKENTNNDEIKVRLIRRKCQCSRVLNQCVCLYVCVCDAHF